MSGASTKSKPNVPGGGVLAPTPFYQLYRRSTLGNALFEALDELIQSGHINPQLAMKVLNQFDKSASETLLSQLRNKCSVKGHLSTYRHCDEVWTFHLRNPTFKLDNNSEHIGPLPGKCRIVACKAGGVEGK